MTKLTDAQLIVLSFAAKRDDGLAIKPINLHAAAAQKVASSLIAKGLLREIRAKRDAPFWREGEDGRFALKITRAGRDAIGVDEGAEAHEPSAPEPGAPASKKRLSKAGGEKTARAGSVPPARSAEHHKGAQPAETASGELRPGSKQAIVVGLMIRPSGATMDELVAATDWLPHTTRAALTGLRHRGYSIERSRGEDKITRYRATPPEPTAAGSKKFASEPAQDPIARAA